MMLSWVDENAFGLFVSYYEVEEDEYGLEREEFVERFEAFRRAVYDFVALHPVGEGARALDLGQAVYVELAEGDESVDLLGWMRELRSALKEERFETVGAITHGSRWVIPDEPSEPHTQLVGTVSLTSWSRPSEPLRRALFVETASRPSGNDDDPGWGPGLYFDTEAVEALGRSPKNAPTALEVAGASFYRAGR